MLTESASDVEPDLLEQQRLASLELAAPRLEGYEIVELIGEGTYGNVWKAVATQTKEMVAIKRLRRPREYSSYDEVQRLASLGAARGIIALRKVHLDSEPYCYVMEYLDGGTLAEANAARGARPFGEAWRIFRQLTEAMCYVHKAQIIHCDLKPENILLDSRGHPRIGDFGQARGQGPQGLSLGTRFYMPPEQARIGAPQPQWDVYALGAILYEMLTGAKPRYDARLADLLSTPSSTGSEVLDRLETYARHLERAPPPLAHLGVKKVDSSVAALLERCLSLDLDQRPQDAAMVLKLIEQCEHARRSRPMLLFGGLAPAVMLLVLGLLTIVLGWFTLGWVEEKWTNYAIDSSNAIAEAMQRSTVAEFIGETQSVKRAAQDADRWRELVKLEPGAEPALQALKDLFHDPSNHVTRWILARSDGVMIANYGKLGFEGDAEVIGVDEATNGKNFAWRGWFNGVEDGEQRLDGPRREDLQAFLERPQTEAFVAQPYLKVGDRNFLALTISCPIPSPSNGPPLGLVAGSIYYQDFLQDVKQFENSEAFASLQGNIVIINDRYQSIYHSQLAANVLRDPENFSLEKHDKCETYRRALAGEERLPGPYVDPVDHRQYVGAARRVELVNGQKLAIIVEQGCDTVLGPVRTLRWLVIGQAALLFAVGGIFLATSSYALLRTLRQEREGVDHA